MRYLKKLFAVFALSFFSILTTFRPAFAVVYEDIGKNFLFGGGRSVGDVFPTLGSLVTIIIRFLFGLAILASLIMLLLGSIKYMNSGGDMEAASAARSTITYAIIGFVLVICAFVIVKVLGVVLGYNII